MQQLRAVFRGRVQGVGFRWTVQSHAQRANLTGHVRNLADGKVELMAQGSKEQLIALLEAIRKDPGGAVIAAVETHYGVIEPMTEGFYILK